MSQLRGIIKLRSRSFKFQWFALWPCGDLDRALWSGDLPWPAVYPTRHPSPNMRHYPCERMNQAVTKKAMGCWPPDLSLLTHWGRDEMNNISQTTFSNVFSSMKMFEFRLKFHWSLFLMGLINNIPALVQIMAWRRPGDKPLSEPMLIKSVYRRIYASLGLNELRYIYTCAKQMRAENWLQHKSLHAFTHTRLRSGGGVGTKSAPQQMGPTSNFPHPLRNHMLQTIFVLNKWQICPRPLRVCVNIHAVAARECQNPPVSAPQPLRAYVNVAILFG